MNAQNVQSENNVLFFSITQDILRRFVLGLLILLIFNLVFSLLSPLTLFFLSIPLLLARDLLQPVEFFSVEFVELRVDVLDGIFCAGNDNVLAGYVLVDSHHKWQYEYIHGVDSSIYHFDDIVENDKGGLQTSELYESLNSPGVSLTTPLDLLTSLAQTSKTEITGTLCLEGFELREEDSGNVLLLGPHTEFGRLDGFLNLVADAGTSHCITDFGEGEGGDLHDTTHLALGLVNTAGDISETPVVM